MQASPERRHGRSRQRHRRPLAAHLAVLNCIADDTALLDSFRDCSQSGIPAWIDAGLVNIHVPLHTIERLNALRNGSPPNSLTAQGALEWLDTITSKTENQVTGRVHLQGPEDEFDNWKSVENFLLPDTPLTARNDASEVLNDLSDSVADVMPPNQSSNAGQPCVSPGPIGPPSKAQPAQSAQTAQPKPPRGPGAFYNAAIESAIERPLPARARSPHWNPDQPTKNLFNYIVWRTHNEGHGPRTSGRYLLLSNDPVRQQQAKMFGVRVKSTDQLRAVLARNRPLSRNGDSTVLESASHPDDTIETSTTAQTTAGEEETDEVVFRPSHRPTSSRSSNTPNVWDPDHFGRDATLAVRPADQRVATSGLDNAGPLAANGTGADGSHASRSRAKGKTARGNVGAASGQPRGGFVRGVPPSRAGKTQQVPNPIDPDSYNRQTPTVQRGRASHRRLWEPS